MTQNLIGLTGRAGSGKDTVARILHDQHDFARVAIAGPLRDMLIALGVPHTALDDRAAKERVLPGFGVTPRAMMQTLGTEWGRTLDPDWWLDRGPRSLRARLTELLRFSARIVVTDVRFANEAQWIRHRGGALWHLRRPDADNVHAIHPSEHGLVPLIGDSILINDQGLEQLAAQVQAAIAGELVITAESA
jgi:hypothetical protein